MWAMNEGEVEEVKNQQLPQKIAKRLIERERERERTCREENKLLKSKGELTFVVQSEIFILKNFSLRQPFFFLCLHLPLNQIQLMSL